MYSMQVNSSDPLSRPSMSKDHFGLPPGQSLLLNFTVNEKTVDLLQMGTSATRFLRYFDNFETFCTVYIIYRDISLVIAKTSDF